MRRLILIAGPSCSGKSTIARSLAETIGSARSTRVLPMDHYYRDLSKLTPAEVAAWNFDVPEALEREMLLQHVQQLLRGERAMLPIYDFRTHTRTKEFETIEPVDNLVVEGLFALAWPELVALATLRVYVDVADGDALDRRISRDVRERGRTAEGVRRQFTQSVVPQARRWVTPSRAAADIVLDGRNDPKLNADRIAARLAAIP